MIINLHEPPQFEAEAEKGDKEMSVQSQFSRTLVAIAAALAMSTVAVTAAVGPVAAGATPAQVSINA